jgi:hypothetical protein
VETNPDVIKRVARKIRGYFVFIRSSFSPFDGYSSFLYHFFPLQGRDKIGDCHLFPGVKKIGAWHLFFYFQV